MGLERLLDPNKKADSGTPKDCLECKIVGVTTLSLSGGSQPSMRGQPTLHAGGREIWGRGGERRKGSYIKERHRSPPGPASPVIGIARPPGDAWCERGCAVGTRERRGLAHVAAPLCPFSSSTFHSPSHRSDRPLPDVRT